MGAGETELIVKEVISFQGSATGAGGAGGSTLVCSTLPATVDFNGQEVVITSGALYGQARIINGTTAAGTITPDTNFGAQIGIGTNFIIVGQRVPLALILSLLPLLLNIDQIVNINAILASETNVFSINTGNYTVQKLRLKSADPGAGNSVIVRLYELINNVLTNVDSFVITSPGDNLANPSTGYYSLMDMFGLPFLTGSNLKVTVQQQVGGGPSAITGEFNYRSG
jgi:hypothetical protein